MKTLLSLGIPILDSQHEDLLERMDVLSAAVADGDPSRARALLGAVLEGAVAHFRTEEHLMESAAFAGLREHAEAHRAFVDEGQQLAAELARTGLSSTVAFRFPELADWVRLHVGGMDLAMARAVRKQ
jgi:hemerythrin